MAGNCQCPTCGFVGCGWAVCPQCDTDMKGGTSKNEILANANGPDANASNEAGPTRTGYQCW